MLYTLCTVCSNGCNAANISVFVSVCTDNRSSVPDIGKNSRDTF